MKSMKRLQFISTTLCLTILGLFSAGCATNGRYVLLKEYGPTVPPGMGQTLSGKTICLKGFTCSENLTKPDPQSKPEELEKFQFVELTKEQDQAWSKEFKQVKKETRESDWKRIGGLRNLFGMEMSGVYALNDPGGWLADTLKLDLESQGATVVGPAQVESADLCVSGKVQFFRVDIYMKIWADLVVDLELQSKQGPAQHRVVHTSGGTVAWVGSTAEFYRPLRECRQKFCVFASREMAKALEPSGTGPTGSSPAQP